MFMKVVRLCLPVCLLCATAVVMAQTSAPTVALPMVGFVVDNAHRLRPIVGIPAAASVGTPLELGFEIGSATIAPGRDYVLATNPEKAWPVLIQVRGAGVDVIPTETLIAHETSVDEPRISRIALSPNGSTAGFLSESQGRLYVLAGLPKSPVAVAELSVEALGSIGTFAVSDDGRSIAISPSSSESGSVAFLTVTGSARYVTSVRHAAAISFLRGSEDAIIADDVENRIYSFSGGQLLSIASSEDGIAHPIAIAVSNDNAQILVANEQSGSVIAIDRNGGVHQPFFCDCRLTGLHPTATESVFRLTDFTGGPVLLFDATTPAPRTIFVP